MSSNISNFKHKATISMVAIGVILVVSFISTAPLVSSTALGGLAYRSIDAQTGYGSSMDAAGIDEQRIVPIRGSSAPSALSLGEDTLNTQAVLEGSRVFLPNDLVNSFAIYEIAFKPATTGPIKTIEITFPAGTDISFAQLIERHEIGNSIITRSGNTITINVLDPVSISAGTFIRIELANIKNPPTPSSNYHVTITTRNSNLEIIDGPSNSLPYKVRQIGTSDIANGAVVGSKISPTFMTSKLLEDDARGEHHGWIPDGSETNFIIFEDSVSGSNPVLINVGDAGSNSQCESMGSLTGFFTMQCANPPPEGSELRYTIINLPLQ